MGEEVEEYQSNQVMPDAPAAAACKHHFEMVKPACKCQRLLWPRRIHALVGLALTCFLVVHFAICVTGLNPDFYQRTVDGVDGALAHLPGFVLIAIFLPFAVQIFGGLWLLKKEGLGYIKKCNRGGKLRYFLQRLSSLVILLFAAIHVATLHEWGLHLVYRFTQCGALARYSDSGLFHPRGAAFQSTVVGFLQTWTAGSPGNLMNSGIALLGLISVWAVAYHVANGAWSGGIVWKLAGTKVSKPLWACFCLLVGMVLATLGSLAWYAFTWSEPAKAVITAIS
jgi:succinate dehydrogenase / fumarate reductase cytochrome b subunit